MSIFRQAANVRRAKLHAQIARHAVIKPASALLAREREYPLTTVGGAAGAGFVLGMLNVHPLRIPGMGALLSGGVAEVVTHGLRLLGEFGAVGLGAATRGGAADDGVEQP